MINVVALVLAVLSLIISFATLIAVLVFQRRWRQTPYESSWRDEELNRDAWLEEIEARGEAVVQRIAEAEQQLRSFPSRSKAVGETAAAHEAVPAADSGTIGLTGGAGADASVPADVPEETPNHATVRDEVHRLADEGCDVTEIARRLALGRGEVDLFLGLSRPST